MLYKAEVDYRAARQRRDDKIIELYSDNDVPVQDILDGFGITRSQLHWLLGKHKVKRHAKGRPAGHDTGPKDIERTRLAIELRDKGWSYAAIAKNLGGSKQSAYMLVKSWRHWEGWAAIGKKGGVV